jgi:hypothetical protein
MTIQNDIDLFFKWVEDRRVEIDSFRESYRYILLMVLLDTLSKCVFPSLRSKKDKPRNKERFLKLINKYSNWKYKDYVSLIQLQHSLNEDQPCTELSKINSNKIINWLRSRIVQLVKYLLNQGHQDTELREMIKRIIDSWPRWRILRPEESDLKIQNFQTFRHKECWKEIKNSTYANLLWQMRNSLIHELRLRGKGMNISSDDSTPYYHGATTMSNEYSKDHSWELYIPPKVISEIVFECANNLKKDLEANAHNPLDSFKFDSSWYEV